jgi:hypothetical protein
MPVLRHAGLTIETREDLPLGERHTVIAGARIGERPAHPGDIGHEDNGIALKGVFHDHLIT